MGRFFTMYSSDGAHTIDLETFVTGCIRLKGHPLAIDVQHILAKQRYCQHHLDEIIAWSERCAVKLEGLLTHLGQEPRCVQGIITKGMSSSELGHKNHGFGPFLNDVIQAKQVALTL